MLNNLTSMFRLVLQLDDGTITNLLSKHHHDLKATLDGGITEWQQMGFKNIEERNICVLIQGFVSALDTVPVFMQITGIKTITNTHYYGFNLFVYT